MKRGASALLFAIGAAAAAAAQSNAVDTHLAAAKAAAGSDFAGVFNRICTEAVAASDCRRQGRTRRATPARRARPRARRGTPIR